MRPDRHLLGKGVLPVKEIPAQQGDARHPARIALEQQSPGLQRQKLHLALRQGNLPALLFRRCVQFPNGAVFVPEFFVVIHHHKVQHQRLK